MTDLSPADAHLAWRRDPAFARPVAAFDHTLLEFAAHGRNAAFAAYDLPFRVHLRRSNGRIYEAIEQIAATPANAAEMHTRAETKLRTVMERMHEAWEDEWETDIEEIGRAHV
jgi:hypothetical protein